MIASIDYIHNRSIPDILKVALLASILVVFSFWLQGDISIGLLDEGWLWYGTWRTALGEIPIRDFFSYDPGRYYWTAGWSMLLGNGIMGLRASVAIFQVFGLTLGLLALRRIIHSWWLLGILGVLLMMWMYPRWKIFDHCIALAGVYFAVLLIEKPSIIRHFAGGVFVGGAAWFGRNHGLYGFVSFFFLILFIWLKIERSDLFKRMAAWGAGILVGYCPMLFMCIHVAGFFDSVIDSVMLLFRLKTTNLPLPVPWPWIGDFSHMNVVEAAESISTGVLFLMLPAFYIVAGVCLIRSGIDALRQNAIFAASLFVGIPYVHYAFSRADINHLALGIHPFLMGLISLPFVFKHAYKRLIGWGLLAVVFVMSCFSVGMSSPYYQKADAPEGSFKKTDIHVDSIWVHRYTANLFQTVMDINTQKIGPGENLLIAPHWAVCYPILQRKSPLWEIFFLFKETEERQREMITELKEKGVDWVILGDVALDGREELRFRNTHHLVWLHLMGEFEPVKAKGLPRNYQLLKRK